MTKDGVEPLSDTRAKTAPELTFGAHAIRSVRKDGRRWLVASDVCEILGLRRSRAAISRLDEDEVAFVVIPTAGGPQRTHLVTESGAYYLSFVSRKPIARRFRRWVTEEVLPQIRRTGAYIPMGASVTGTQCMITGDQIDLLTRLSQPGPHMVFVMPGQEPYIEEVDPRQFIRDLDRHDVEGLIHAMNLIGSVWSMCRKIDGAMYCSTVLQSGIGRQLDDAIRIGVDLSRSVFLPAREES